MNIKALFIICLLLSVTLIIPSNLSVEAQESPSEGSFGYTGPEWTNLTLIDESSYVEVQGIDAGFTMRFYKESQGYNTIIKNGVILIQDERWFLEYSKGPQWNSRGIPQNVYYDIISPVNIEVTRTYTDYINTHWNITYILFGGSMPKIMFNGTLDQDTYRIRWALSGINKDYYEQDVNKIKLYNSTEAPFYVDYQDVFDSKGNITEIDFGGWGNHKIDFNFNIGNIAGYYDLDPSFGETTVFAGITPFTALNIVAIRANMTETGCVYSMSIYLNEIRLAKWYLSGIYDSANMTDPLNLLGETAITQDDQIAWKEVNLINNITLIAGTYWLAAQLNQSGGNIFRWAAGGVNQRATDTTPSNIFGVLNDPFNSSSNANQAWSIFANYTVGACPIYYINAEFHTGISSMVANSTNLVNNTDTLFSIGESNAVFENNISTNYQFWRYELPESEDNHTHYQTYTRSITANYTLTAYALEAGGGGVSGVSMLLIAIVGGFALMIAIVVLRKK